MLTPTPPQPMGSSLLYVWQRFLDRLEVQVDGASLGFFRIFASLFVLRELVLLATGDGIETHFAQDGFFFRFPFFPFVQSAPGMLPYGIYTLLVISCVAVLIGWHTRLMAGLLAIGMIYHFLLDVTAYSDEAWLMCLMCLLLAWLPSNRWLSADAQMGWVKERTVPYWAVWVVRVQVSLVLVFGALNKLNGDWLAAAPLAEWAALSPLADRFAPFLKDNVPLVTAIAWGMPVIELLIVAGLWLPRLRTVAWVLLTLYLVPDYVFYRIAPSAIVLWGMSFVFFAPSWPRGIADRLGAVLARIPSSLAVWKGIRLVGNLVNRLFNWFDDTPVIGEAKVQVIRETPAPFVPQTFSTAAKYGVIAWVATQVFLPVRFVFYGDRLDWTESASRFSWRGQTVSRVGDLTLSMVQPSQELRWPIQPTEQFPLSLSVLYPPQVLKEKQLSEGMLRDVVQGPPETLSQRAAGLGLNENDIQRLMNFYHLFGRLQISDWQVEMMSRQPELARQYAQEIARMMKFATGEEVTVQGKMEISLNNRPWALCLPETVNLSQVASAMALAPSLIGLKEKLPDAAGRLAFAKELAEEHQRELDMRIPDSGRSRTKEPAPVPPLSDEDEAWFMAKYGGK